MITGSYYDDDRRSIADSQVIADQTFELSIFSLSRLSDTLYIEQLLHRTARGRRNAGPVLYSRPRT